MNTCECISRCSKCGGITERDVQLVPAPTPALVVERTEHDGATFVVPVIAVALTADGDVHLLIVRGDGIVAEPGFLAHEVLVRERGPDEEVGLEGRLPRAGHVEDERQIDREDR